MILVVGLVVAGVAGIAAAFYFSIRSGRRGDKHNSRARSARGAGRIRAGASAADSGSGRSGNESRAANGGRAVNARRANQASADYKDDTGPNSTMDFGELDLSGERRPGGSRRAEADPRSTPAAFDADAADAADDSRMTRTRRRVGFRKGAELDEELWPTEAFGGVSDEQFWDDLASDKPLTTTARTAQQDPGRRTGRAARRIEPRGRDETPRLPAAPGRTAASGRASAGANASANAAVDRGIDAEAVSPADAADQPLVQAAYGATQPVAPLKPAASPRSAAAHPAAIPPTATPPPATPLTPVGGTGPLPRSGRQPAAVAQPEQGWRQTSPSAEDDPLTSSAFSLREAGPVDGRSLRTAGPSRGGEYQPSPAEVSQPLAPGDTGSGGYLPSPPAPRYLAAGYGTAPYETPAYGTGPQGTGSHSTGPQGTGSPSTGSPSTGRYGNAPYGGDPDRTPPSADTYGYRSPGPLDEPRRPNVARPNGVPPNGMPATSVPPAGARPGARHAGPDDRGRPARPAYPPQAGQPGGGRHQNGGYQGGGHQANGYPEAGRHGGGQRPPYDPRDDYRRLTPPALTAGRTAGGNRRAGANRGAGAGR